MRKDGELRKDGGVRKEWEALSAKLNPSQRSPMEKLLKLTGLVSVKRIALQFYADVLTDQS